MQVGFRHDRPGRSTLNGLEGFIQEIAAARQCELKHRNQTNNKEVNMKRSLKTMFAITCVNVITTVPLLAQFQYVFTFDEFGNGNFNGTPVQGVLSADPSGGITSSPVLVYTLPIGLFDGDLLLTEPGAPGNTYSDVVRFWNPTSSTTSQVIFYSDFSSTDPADAPADVGLPNQLFNPVVINEIGPEGNNGAVYSPPQNTPGFDYAGAVIQYNIVSDGVVPEPSTMALAGLGGGLFLLWLKRRNQARA